MGFNKVTEDYKKLKAEETSDNTKELINHLNIASIRQFGEVIGAPESSISRWVRKRGDQGVQPGYFFWLVYEAFGMLGLQVLFTGTVTKSKDDATSLVKQMGLEEAITLQTSLCEHIAMLARGNTAEPS